MLLACHNNLFRTRWLKIESYDRIGGVNLGTTALNVFVVEGGGKEGVRGIRIWGSEDG